MPDVHQTKQTPPEQRPAQEVQVLPYPGDPSTWELLVEEDTYDDFQGSWERPRPPPEFVHTSPFRHDALAGMHPSQAANLGTSFEEASRVIREGARCDRKLRLRDAPPHRSMEPSQGMRGRAPVHRANAAPLATDCSHPQTTNFRDPAGRRQSTLTGEGGFTSSAPPTRPASHASSSSQHPVPSYDW